jgi:hypothetical protein
MVRGSGRHCQESNSPFARNFENNPNRHDQAAGRHFETPGHGGALLEVKRTPSAAYIEARERYEGHWTAALASLASRRLSRDPLSNGRASE